MAWSWSHTPEAYENARLNLFDLDLDTLRVIYAEWHARSITSDFNEPKYRLSLAIAKQLDAEELAEWIWDAAAEQQTCDNGGFNAWMCPYGCGCHTVAFDRDEL